MIIFGSKYVERAVRRGICLDKWCPSCNVVKQLEEYESVRYFTLYFVPIFPMGGKLGAPFFKCFGCGNCYVITQQDYIDAEAAVRKAEREEKMVISCVGCNKSLRIPQLDSTIVVTCPHCKLKFDVRRRS